MPDLEHARPSTIRDAAWQTAYRLGFPLARIWWRLRRQRHEGALVAVHVGPALHAEPHTVGMPLGQVRVLHGSCYPFYSEFRNHPAVGSQSAPIGTPPRKQIFTVSQHFD